MTDLMTDLIRDEELRLFAYDDATGKPLKKGDTIEGNITIGIGRNLTGRGITKAEAMLLFAHDIDIVERELMFRAGEVFVVVHDNAQRGLLNMAFNMGVPRLMGFKKMWAAMEVYDYASASAEALNSRWARQVGDRAERIAELIRNG